MKTAEGTSQTQALYDRAKERIPGGSQLFGKRQEVFAPNQWPAYFREARGCEVWDLDGRHYYDMSYNGIGACVLGFADPDVNRAVEERIRHGNMCTLNPPEEVELADMLCAIHPWASRVRFARSGGEAVAIAVRIARATTDRSVVAVCGYHGWHDWYLAANLGDSDALRGYCLPGLDPLGVPSELRGTTAVFRYNSREDFQAVLDRHGSRLAAVVMEPCRYRDPDHGFLEFVKEGAHAHNALLIFDEISIAWRLHYGGAHLKFGVDPDIAVFAKSLSNGYPMAAVIGTEEAMQGAHVSFISSTYWTESIGPVAAVAALRKMREVDVPGHVARMGNLVMDSFERHAKRHDLPVVTHESYPCLAQFRFDHENAMALRTLFVQLMLERGFLGGWIFYPSLAHTESIVSQYDVAIDEVFAEIAESLHMNDVEDRLKGPVAHNSFKRLI